MSETTDNHFWVFGYGSLMWNPGFEFLESRLATLSGLHRAACIYSWVHRGTRERPGIVLGLDRGGACKGMAFRISNRQRNSVTDYLRERELVTDVYIETHRDIRLDTGETVRCLTFRADRGHQQYAGRLSHERLLQQIRGASGKSGPNESYIIETAAQLKRMGIRDIRMEQLARELDDG